MNTYNKRDQQIHQLAQIIAKFNRSYGIKKEDDSHTNLSFDKVGMCLFGRWVESAKGKVIMALNLVDFTIHIFNSSKESLFSTKIVGKTQTQVEKAIKTFLPPLELDEEQFMKPLHFEIPKYEFADNPFSTLNKKDVLKWADYRSLANDACLWLLNHLQIEAEIRIWPHHFDTGIYVQPTSKIGLGFGLAMQDDTVNSPYFYFSGYGLDDHDIDFDSTHDLKQGSWVITEHFKGAVLELSNANHQTLHVFLKEVSAWYLHH